MNDSLPVVAFENKRWKSGPQLLEFRHRTAAAMVLEGTVLDLGCGDGLLLDLLRSQGVSGVGLDASPEAIRTCAEKGLEVQIHTLSGPLPYQDASFDTVVLLDVLEHVYEPEALLTEAARVARKRVIVSVPNFSSLPARLQVLVGNVPENNRPRKGHLYWFNYGVLTNMVMTVGLRITTLKTNTFFPCTLLGNRLISLLPKSLVALSFVAELQVPTRGGQRES